MQRRSTRETPQAGAQRGAQDGGVAAVERALSILECLGAYGGVLDLSDLSNRTGLYKSTLLRLLQSLIRYRYVSKVSESVYALGPTLLRLGTAYQANHDVSDLLRPVMRGLATQAGETVAYYVKDGDRRVCAYRVESHRPLRYMVDVGEILPIQLGSGGRILAAFSGERGPLYDRIRREMWYAAFGERDADVAGFGSPVFCAGNKLAGALIVAGPINRVTFEFAKRMRPALLEAAADVTAALGADETALRSASASCGEMRGGDATEVNAQDGRAGRLRGDADSEGRKAFT